jgi:hypothetical protein
MRPPRARFTVRGLMVAVAVAGLCSAVAIRLDRLRARYEAMAARNAEMERRVGPPRSYREFIKSSYGRTRSIREKMERNCVGGATLAIASDLQYS